MGIGSQQYEQEIRDQEIKANKRILLGIKYYMITLCVIYALCIVGFFDMDTMIMTVTMVISMPLFIACLVIGNQADLSKPWIKYLFMVIICVSTGTICSILTFHAVLLQMLPLLFAMQCREKKVLWFTFIVNIFATIQGCVVGFYFGLCDANLMISGNYRRSYFLSLVEDGKMTLPVNESTIYVILIFEVLPQIMILFTFTLIIQAAISKNKEDSARIVELTWRKERDISTGVYNKNTYEEMADEHYYKVPRIASIYWDLNNLKKTNDKFGHDEGDALIQLLAATLLDLGDSRYRVFRLGGDEFLMLIENPEIGEPEKVIEEAQNNMAELRTPKNLSVSAAVGWSTGEGKEVRKVVRNSDANMYSNKQAKKKQMMANLLQGTVGGTE